MSNEPCRDSCHHEYLTDLSPTDKPWDINKLLSKKLAHLYKGTIYHRLAERMGGCSSYLEFGWVEDLEADKARLKLKNAHFCRCRHCVVCQWRRSLRWTARFLEAMPAILRDYPDARFIFLTLTIRNCEVTDLRSTLNLMNKSWQRLSQRKQFPAIGFARSTEVTRNWDVYYKGAYQGRMGTKTLNKWKKEHRVFKPDHLRLEPTTEAHPHFHALLMVEPGYFAGHSYLSQQNWTDLWQSCLRVDYPPKVDVRAVKPNKRWLANSEDLTAERTLASAVVETFKYSVKPEDLIGQETEQDQQWLLQLTKQLDKTRAITLGGTFRNYLSEAEPEDLVGKDDTEDKVSASSVFFAWQEIVQKYLKAWED